MLDDELVDAPSADEHLDELLEEEEEVSPEVQLVLVEATSTSVLATWSRTGITLCTLGQQLV